MSECGNCGAENHNGTDMCDSCQERAREAERVDMDNRLSDEELRAIANLGYRGGEITITQKIFVDMASELLSLRKENQKLRGAILEDIERHAKESSVYKETIANLRQQVKEIEALIVRAKGVFNNLGEVPTTGSVALEYIHWENAYKRYASKYFKGE